MGHLAVVLVANAPACDIGSDLRGGHDTTSRPAACGDVVDEHCRPCAVTWCRRRASSRRPGRKWRQPGTRSSASCNRPLSRPASRLAAAACPARPQGLERVQRTCEGARPGRRAALPRCCWSQRFAPAPRCGFRSSRGPRWPPQRWLARCLQRGGASALYTFQIGCSEKPGLTECDLPADPERAHLPTRVFANDPELLHGQ